MSIPYTPTKVLITGAAGFLGSYLTDAILDWLPTCNVIGFDVMDYSANIKNLTNAENTGRFYLFHADIRNAYTIRYILNRERPDTVIHCAALSHVDSSFGHTLLYTSVNTVGTATVMEVISAHNAAEHKVGRYGVQRVLHISTDEAAPSTDTPANELTPRMPTSAYSASKAAAEMMVLGFFNAHKLPVMIIRLSNMVGARQAPEKLLVKFCHRLIRNMNLDIHGDGAQTRFFLHVLDAVDALILIIQYGEIGQFYHVDGPPESERNVLQVAHALFDELKIAENERAGRLTHVRNRLAQDARYYLDGSRVRALGWMPRRTFEQAVHEVVEFALEYPNYWQDIDTALEAHPGYYGHLSV